MANKENLIPSSARTPSERRKNARKAGKKSGEVRRARKKFKEDLLAALEVGNIQQNIVASVIDKALKGDLKAVEFIRDTIGEKPVDKLANTDAEGNTMLSPPIIHIHRVGPDDKSSSDDK